MKFLGGVLGDRRFVRLKSHSRIEEIEVEHHGKSIEKGFQHSTRLAAAPDSREREDAAHVIHAALQPFQFSCSIC
jgi:hypothetical protein